MSRLNPSAARVLIISGTALALSGCLTGCKVPTDPQGFVDRLKLEWNALVTVASGGRNPLKHPQPAPSVDLATTTRRNAELLVEMYRVIFRAEPADRQIFASYVDSMNQGASLEGIYNGFAHSSEYRELESKHPGASKAALDAFSEELASLEAELRAPTVFDAHSAEPLARPVDPGAGGTEAVEFSKDTSKKPAPSPTAQASDEIERVFQHASVFTLKRVLGDEALKVIAAKREKAEDLSRWYGRFAARMAMRGVDFGVPLRNKADEAFHRQWASASGEDRLSWEVLNRVHRLMNGLDRPAAQAAPSPSPLATKSGA